MFDKCYLLLLLFLSLLNEIVNEKYQAYSKCAVSENSHLYYLVHDNCALISDVCSTLASLFCVSCLNT